MSPEIGIVVANVSPQLLKRTGVQESLYPLSGGKLVVAVLLLHRSLTTSEEHLLPSLDERPDLICLSTHIYIWCMNPNTCLPHSSQRYRYSPISTKTNYTMALYRRRRAER